MTSVMPMRWPTAIMSSRDGSIGSLEPFWEWYLSRLDAGFPEIPIGSRPSKAWFLQYEHAYNQEERVFDDALRAQYAMEPMSHYLFELISTYADDARWDLYPPFSKDDSDTNTTVVVATGWHAALAEEVPYNQVSMTLKGREGKRTPTAFRDFVIRRWEIGDRTVLYPKNGSILEPLLLKPRAAADDPRRIAPIGSKEDRQNPHPDRMSIVSEDLVLADPAANLDHFETARSLDPELLAAGLNGMGAHIMGAPITPESLLDDRTQIHYGESLVLLEPETSGGQLKKLRIELVQMSEVEWQVFDNEIKTLARRAGARFGPWYEFAPEA